MTDEDMIMEYQMALADLAGAQRKLFRIRAMHQVGNGPAGSWCRMCHCEWPCSTRKALES